MTKMIILASAATVLGLAVGLPSQTTATGHTQDVAAPAATAATGDSEAGRDVYAQGCRACHSGAIAPSLKGVVGRHVASVSDYGYSDALKAKSTLVWTPETLNTFLTGPEAFAPGTRMVKIVPDAQQRADVIAYLQSLSSAE